LSCHNKLVTQHTSSGSYFTTVHFSCLTSAEQSPLTHSVVQEASASLASDIFIRKIFLKTAQTKVYITHDIKRTSQLQLYSAQCISGANALEPFLLAPQIRLSFTIVHVEAVGKMRNCGMWKVKFGMETVER